MTEKISADGNGDGSAKTVREREIERLLNELATVGGKLTADEDIVFRGTKIVLPETMTLPEAIDMLKAKRKEDDQEITFSRTFNYRPWDGARATMNALKKAFGFVTQVPTHTFFGERLPHLITVSVAHNETEQVPWGSMQVPHLPGMLLSLEGTGSPDYGMIFMIEATGPKKYRHHIEGLFKLVQRELETNSLYRGKAFDGQNMPQFLDLGGVDPKKVVYAQETRTQLEANIWSLLRYSRQMEDLGVPMKRAVLLEGPFGCLAGDAKISINRGGKGYEIKIQDLVRRFNGEDARYSWDPSIPTMVQREMPDGTIRLGQVASAWCSGRKSTYTVTTETGRSVRATAEHPFLTDHGWLRLDQIVVGDLIHVRGSQSGGSGTQRDRGERRKYRSLSVGPHHPYGKGIGSNKGWHVAEHRLVVEAADNGLTLPEYLIQLKAGQIEGLKFLDPTEWAVHHVDEDTLNNELSNLEKVRHRDHHLQHVEGTVRHVLYKVATERVSSITPYREEMTFDIEVIGDPRNFVANGFVVHNSGKTLAAYLTAQIAIANGWTFVLCRPGRDNLQAVMGMARLYQPAVVFFEDVDTVASAESDNVQQLLDIFDGVQAKGTRIVVVLTTNHVERIHKGMVRPGRLDAVIHIGPLDPAGVRKLVEVTVPEDLLAPNIDWPTITSAMDGFLPAFIREAIDRTVRYNVARNKGTVTKLEAADFAAAAEGLRPQLALMEEAREVPTREVLANSFAEVVRDALHNSELQDHDDDAMFWLKTR